MSVLPIAELEKLLAEDIPYGDLTTEALGVNGDKGHITLTARDAMTVAAIEDAQAIFAIAGIEVEREVRSGDTVVAGTCLLRGEGHATGLLRSYKVAQTLVEVWSGVATATRRMVAAARMANPAVVVACTRKNVPGTKGLAVAAVKAGGGVMHRLGLSETILLFAEHRMFRPNAGLDDLAHGLRLHAPEKKLVIEVHSIDEAIAAAQAGFDVIQTEKFTPSTVAEVVTALAAIAPRAVIAATGGINLDNAAAYAQAGASVLVTSWPYTAQPRDVAVTIGRRD
ncbi:MAG: ModD protein [Xanthobacteraceae bacterium]|nr:MAG: ModD protein [Xanthobacteraceae bacterium]